MPGYRTHWLLTMMNAQTQESYEEVPLAAKLISNARMCTSKNKVRKNYLKGDFLFNHYVNSKQGFLTLSESRTAHPAAHITFPRYHDPSQQT